MISTLEITRRDLLRKGMAGAAVGTAALALPGLARADGRAGGPESVQVAEIYELQAAFHRAKTTQDLDLMMSLWAGDATFTNRSTGTTYNGSDQIRSFWAGSGHDVGNFASGSFDVKTIVNDTFLAGTLRNVGGKWLFWHMTAGPSSPLSYDHYYYP